MSSIRLNIAGEEIGFPAFLSILGNAQRILRDIERGISHRRPGILWVVRDLGANGTLDATIESRPLAKWVLPDDPQRVGFGFVAGLRNIESGESLPPFFSDTGLDALEEIATRLAQGRRGNASSLHAVTIEDQESAHLTHVAREKVRELRSPKHQALGSIIGNLDALSVHGEPRYLTYDMITRRAVRCEFPREQLEDVKEALGARVVVSGTVVRNARGDPLRVDDAEFAILPNDDVLPVTDEIYGIAPQLTGDLSSQEYLTEIRGS